MSDENPTERFDAAGDAPTERITAADTVDEVPSDEVVEERKSRKLMIILGSIGGALLLGVIILLVVLLTRGNGTPTAGESPSASPTPSASASASATPSATPSASPTPTPTPTPTQDPAPPPPPPPPPVVESFYVSDDDVDCSSGDPVPLSFSWDTNGSSVTFAVGTQYAESGAYQSGLPTSGGINIDYQCGQSSGGQIYSIAVLDGGGGVIGRDWVEVRED